MIMLIEAKGDKDSLFGEPWRRLNWNHKELLVFLVKKRVVDASKQTNEQQRTHYSTFAWLLLIWENCCSAIFQLQDSAREWFNTLAKDHGEVVHYVASEATTHLGKPQITQSPENLQTPKKNWTLKTKGLNVLKWLSSTGERCRCRNNRVILKVLILAIKLPRLALTIAIWW